MSSDMEVVDAAITSRTDELNALAQYLWDNPEVNFHEVKAHDYITKFLEDEGFSVQRNYILSTAFRAEFGAGSGPIIAIMCEYDALPGLGHSCGHNLIAECGVAAGIAVKEVMEGDPSISAKVVVLGTPAEEEGQGKVYLLNGGAFDDIDAAIMAHPYTMDGCVVSTNGISKLGVKYTGLSAHEGVDPWDGINALDGAVGAYMNVSLLRQQMMPDWRATGIVTSGGVSSNVIPDLTEMEFTIRAGTLNEMSILRKKVDACFNAAALATGCTVEVKELSPVVDSLIPNLTMGKIYRGFAESLGMTFGDEDPTPHIDGSTDAGNVSHVIPVLHPFYKLDTTATNHSAEYAKATATPDSFKRTLVVARAMALTVLEMMRNSQAMEDIREEFQSSVVKDVATPTSKL